MQHSSDSARMSMFESAYKESYLRIYRTARRITGNVHDAEELTEETYLILLERLICGEEINNPPGFLLAVLRNLLGNYLQRKAKTQQYIVPMDDMVSSGVGLNLSMDILLPASLSPEEREILLLRIDDKLPYKDIAPLLGITEEAARVRFMRARMACAKIMSGSKHREGGR